MVPQSGEKVFLLYKCRTEFKDRPYVQPLEHTFIAGKDVEKVLSALNPGKSQRPDLFHPKYLKETMDFIIQPLQTIFQKSLDEGILPTIWKKANISAIFKKGEKKKTLGITAQ